MSANTLHRVAHRRVRALATAAVLATSVVVGAFTLAAPTGAVGAPPSSTTPALTITDEQVDQAIQGLFQFQISNAMLDDITEPCAILRQDQVNWFLQQRSLVPNTATYDVFVFGQEEYGEAVITLQCGVDVNQGVSAPDPAAPVYVLVEASWLIGAATFENVLAQMPEVPIRQPGPPDIGGEIAGLCVDHAISSCILHWHRNELVITMMIVGPPGALVQQPMIDMFVAMIPPSIENLTAALMDPVATTTLVPETTVATVPTTVVPEITVVVPETTPTTVLAPATTVAVLPPTSAPAPPPPPVTTVAPATIPAMTTEPQTTTSSTSTTTDGSTTEPESEDSPSSLFVSGEPPIPAGEPGELSVVLVGDEGMFGLTPVIIVNNTDDRAFDVRVEGVARDADGSLVAVGSNITSAPFEIPPGGWGFTEMLFGSDQLGGDETFEFLVTAETDSDDTYSSVVDLSVTEATQEGALSPA